MKRIMVVVVLLLMITAVYSQATQGFNYQTVVRDANGAALSNKLVVFHISLKSGDGTITYYSENHEKTTTSLGIANMAVGEGTFESGSFATIPWSTVSIQMSVEIKPQGSTTFTDMGSVILRPVPFAMYALNGQPGSQGIQGEVGPEGPIGITGLQGPEGKEGPQGIQGTQGIQGEAGTGLTNKGNWSSGSSYISGDYVFATASIGTNNSMWVCKSATSFVSTTPPKDDLTNSWIEFQAPAGPQGIQGLQGNQGLKGDAGPIGLTGSTGLTGAQGNGIVETINNGNGTYTFKYTDNTQFTTSNLTGPQGQQGIQGIQGIQGLTGNTGATGADGKSINWRGNYATDPLNPLLNDAYYNTSTTPKKSFIYNGSAWVVMTQDGVAGAAGTVGSTGAVGPIGPAGTSIDWQPWTSRPASPLKNQAYYNPTSKISEIWNGTSWSTVATDGAIGMQGNPGSTGATGNNGISINWRGNFASDPLTPVLNDAYYNTSTTPKQSRIYNGTAWVVMTQDGAAGSNGTNGSNGASIIWKGDLASAPTSPVTNWAYYNTALFKSYVYNGSTWDIMTQDGSVGNTGSNGATGANGTSIIWKGSFASAPTSPVTNWAYYNTADKKSYVYDNTNNWQIITQDGAAGTGLTNKGNWSTGISYISGDYVFDRSSSSSTINSMWICKTALTSTTQPYLDNNPSTGHWVEFQAPAGPQGLTGNAGAAGTNGASIIWKGALASAPTSPVTNWAYYNTTDKKSYVYNVSVWDLMTQDGAVGSNGISIIWKGSLASAPLSPVTNWAYYNTTNKKSYVYDNTNNWQIITQDGANGTNGTNGTDGTSIIWKGSLASAPLSPLNNWAYYNTADKKSYVYNGSIWQIISQDGMPITGTTGQTLYNTGGSTWAASSNLFNNNTNVGIGTTTPTQKLEVDGNLQLDHNLYDYNTQPGTLNQILTSGGPTAGVLWKSPSTLSLPTGTGTTGQLALWTGTNNGLQGISNLTWGTNLQVTSLSNADPTAPIMEVRNILGQVVFAVYQSGVRIFVDHVAKGAKGGFAVGGLTSKADPPEYLRIYPDSARIYLNPPQKGAKGGFAVGGLTSKGESNNYMQMTPNNYLIGHQSGSKITTGIYNSFFGFQTGSLNTTGSSNVFIGYQAGAANNANYNSFMGYQSGKANTSGTLNSFIGYNTGLANTTGSSNVFIGNQAGSTAYRLS